MHIDFDGVRSLFPRQPHSRERVLRRIVRSAAVRDDLHYPG
jgi:hypothetical protein